MVNASKSRTLHNKMDAGKSTAAAVVFSFVLVLLLTCVPAFAQGLAEDDGLNKPQTGDCDQEGPYFSNWAPYLGEPDIPVNLEKFSFNIYDDRSEVAIQTLKIFFPDFTVSNSSSGLVTRHKAGFYEVEYNLPAEYQFHWGDSVHVRAEVYDTYAEAPNLGVGETFFFTISDENNPEIIPISPIDGDVAVDPNTEMRLTLTDDLSGLNFDSLQVWINGAPLDAANWSVAPDPLESQLTIQPQNFLNNQMVLVRVRITDMADNPAEANYQFQIIAETEPPVIRFIYPEKNGTAAIFPNDSLVFEIDDRLSGISLAESAVELLLNAEKIKIDTLMQQNIGATGYRFTIKPRGGFRCNETGVLQVLAVDNSHNQFSDENTFSVIADSSGPAIDLIEPGQAATDVPREHGMLVQITDNIAGVDNTSLQLKINDQMMVTDGGSVYEGVVVSQENGVFQLSADVVATWNDTVSISVIAKDYAFPPNETTAKFYYYIVEDRSGPIVTAIQPLPGDTAVAQNTTIEFEIEDSLSGINWSDFQLTVAGILYDSTSSQIVWNEKSDTFARITWHPIQKFQLGQVVPVMISVADRMGNSAAGDFDYAFTILRDLSPPEIRLLTPNTLSGEISWRQNFRVQVTDTLSGLDLASLVFTLNNEAVVFQQQPVDSLNWVTDHQSYILEFTPNSSFENCSTVMLGISASDLAANEAVLNESFALPCDQAGPYFANFDPADQAVNVPNKPLISFDVFDDLAGVDAASISLTLAGETVIPDTIISINNSRKIHIAYQVVQVFAPETLVTLAVSAMDSAGNFGNASISFTIAPDVTPPEITWVLPVDLENASQNTPVQFRVCDEESGIDTTTLQLMLRNTAVTPTIETLSDFCVTVTYNDAEETVFGYRETVPFQFMAQNRSGLAAVLDSSFITANDLTQPFIELVSPADNISRNAAVVFRLYDPETGIVPDSTRLRIDLANGEFADYENITLAPADQVLFEVENTNSYLLTFNPENEIQFDYFQTVAFSVFTQNPAGLSVLLNDVLTVMAGDTTAPEITNVTPVAGSQDVPIATVVEFDVIDDYQVDDATIQVQLFDESNTVIPATVHLTNVSDGAAFHVSASPVDGGFSLGQLVRLVIDAADTSGNQAQTFIAEFTTLFDREGPHITTRTPQENEQHVSVTTGIAILLWDDLSGIARDSVTVSWHVSGTSGNYDISPAGFQFATFADTTVLSVAAGAVDFPYDRTVILVCEAMDTEGNRSRKDIPFHTQKFDEDSPLLQMISPLTDAEVERHLAEFVFDLWDTTTYVVPDSIQVTLQKNTLGRNGDFEYNEWFFSTVDQGGYLPKIEIQSDGSKRLRVHCVSPEDNPFDFNWNDEFLMRITAHDSCSNWLDTTLTFQVQTDILPPEIADEYPEWGSVENDPNTGFSFTLFDDLAGLDTSTIVLELAIRHRFEEIPTPSNWTSGDTLVVGKDVQITDSVVEAGIVYELTYEFVNTEHLFDYNQIVGIRISARDRVPVFTNVLDTVYSFYTEAKLPDLSIVSILKDTRNSQIGDSVTISALIKNEFVRIDQPVTVAFVIDECDAVFRQTIQPPFDANSSVMTLPPIRLPLNSQGRLNIVITVDDEDLIEELDENNNEFETSVDVEGGELVVISDPFTPNGDGMNDIAAFYCEEFKLDDPVIKIFDVRGKMVRELRELTSDKRFLWNGRDTNSNRLTTGAYLYILIDNGIPLKRGSVTLIR